MAAKRCPLCGGNVKDNYCDSCGYSLPDEEDISALYNYDPSDYPQEEPAIREITPKHITEEIFPNRPEPFKFEVREDPKTKNDNPKDSPFLNPYAGQNNGASGTSRAGGANGTQNQSGRQAGGQSPYAQPYLNNVPPQNNPQQNQNPYANNGNFKPYANANQPAGSFGDFLKKYWLLAVVSFFAPFFGIVWLCIDNKAIDKKYRGYIIALIILGFILPP